MQLGVVSTIFDNNGKPDSSGSESKDWAGVPDRGFATLISSANDPDTVLGLNGDTLSFGKSDNVAVLKFNFYLDYYGSGSM